MAVIVSNIERIEGVLSGSPLMFGKHILHTKSFRVFDGPCKISSNRTQRMRIIGKKGEEEYWKSSWYRLLIHLRRRQRAASMVEQWADGLYTALRPACNQRAEQNHQENHTVAVSCHLHRFCSDHHVPIPSLFFSFHRNLQTLPVLGYKDVSVSSNCTKKKKKTPSLLFLFLAAMLC